MAVHLNLLQDHGRNPGPGEKAIIGKMLENAYNAGFEAGAHRARGLPYGYELKARCLRLFHLINVLKRAIGKTDYSYR